MSDLNINHSTFIFENAGEAWQVMLFIALAVALAWWGWKRYGQRPPGALGTLALICRSAGLVLLTVIIMGPAWQTTTTTTLPGRLLVAIDRSASMSRTDGPGGQERIAIAAPLAKALIENAPRRHYVVQYHSIGAVPGTLTQSEVESGKLTAPGLSSPLADELSQLVEDEHPDALVVVSDGRVTTGSTLQVLPSSWRTRDLVVNALAAGSTRVEPELIIDEVVNNSEVALNEREGVTVRLSTRALGDGPVHVTVAIDGETAATVEVPSLATDSTDLHPLDAKLEVIFHHEGPAKLQVTVEHGQGKTQLRRTQEVSVSVSERKLKVLMLAQRPRYEMRYLREAFRRDKTVLLHAYLADGKWRRWGTGTVQEVGPDHLPLSRDEVREYDVVILGDLGPENFNEAELTELDNAVRQSGTGLVWLPGETGAIADFASTKLGTLLPVDLPDATTISGAYLANLQHRLHRTTTATQQGLLDAGDVEWDQLPALFGSCPVLSAKPGAEVLVVDEDNKPVVVSRGFGAGRALFVGVDDTWRWRRNAGDRYLHRFHSQLFRYVAAGRRLGNQPWRMYASPRRATPGEIVTLQLQHNGADDAKETTLDKATLRLKGPGGEQLLPLSHQGNGYAATLPAPAPGLYALEVVDGPDPRLVECEPLLVLPPSEELRDPRLDLPALSALTQGSGGKVYLDPKPLVEDLPDLSHSQSVTNVTGLWDSLWALLAVLVLFATEWSIRRLNRLP